MRVSDTGSDARGAYIGSSVVPQTYMGRHADCQLVERHRKLIQYRQK